MNTNNKNETKQHKPNPNNATPDKTQPIYPKKTKQSNEPHEKTN